MDVTLSLSAGKQMRKVLQIRGGCYPPRAKPGGAGAVALNRLVALSASWAGELGLAQYGLGRPTQAAS